MLYLISLDPIRLEEKTIIHKITDNASLHTRAKDFHDLAFFITVFSIFLFWAPVWGPVEWVRDQLTGWGGSSQKQNSKKMHLVFRIFWI